MNASYQTIKQYVQLWSLEMPLNEELPEAIDLSALLKGLNEAGIEFIVVGGLAAIIQGAPITTSDLDIVHRQTDGNISKLIKFLKSVDAYHRRPDDIIIEPTKKQLKEKGHILLTTRFGPLYISAFIEKDYGFEELLCNTVEIIFQGHKVYVLSLETIIKLKRDSKDPKDIYRMPILEETLQQRIEDNG